MKSFKYVFSLAIFLLFILSLSAQEGFPVDTAKEVKKEKKSSSRLLFGGDIGASFGNNSSSIYIGPRLGYRVNEKFVTGLGLMYSYSKYERVYMDGIADYKYTMYGGSVFGHYEVVRGLFTNARFEEFNFDSNLNDESEWISALYLGAGYGFQMGRGMMQIGFEYDVLYDEDKSPYSSGFRAPIITVFF